MAASLLARLWQDLRLPIEDALYTADGWGYDVEPNPEAPGGLEFGERFDLAELLREDEDWMSEIDPMREVELPGGAGYLCGGEGSHGSEGFFGRLDADRKPVWIVFLADGNPFLDIAVHGDTATFTSTSGIAITLDLDHPVPENHPDES
ncbi:hypothetical protein [Amycolatopsis anabasis]|uniref:hypothetical protein n=1 Tax=Amycolatopsis anabasis TaxID=1840409 RepID=UPI001C55342C|nr:hypothetical protein [Amycolatopsis anabasis]